MGSHRRVHHRAVRVSAREMKLGQARAVEKAAKIATEWSWDKTADRIIEWAHVVCFGERRLERVTE
jgi:hypothetical protein